MGEKGGWNLGRQEKGRLSGPEGRHDQRRTCASSRASFTRSQAQRDCFRPGRLDQHRETVFGRCLNSKRSGVHWLESVGWWERDEVRGFWLRAKDEPRQNRSGLLVFGAGWIPREKNRMYTFNTRIPKYFYTSQLLNSSSFVL